jgi:hypothetical protein
MRVVTGGDWSVGLGTDSELYSALLTSHLGEGLREIYSEAVEQPLPAEFSRLLGHIRNHAVEHESSAGTGGPRSAPKNLFR